MDIRLTTLARKYAQAFLNLFMDQFTLQEYKNLHIMSEFFEFHRTTVFFLSLQSIPAHEKEKVLANLIEEYHLPKSLHTLVATLVRQGRASLIGKTLGQICELYRKKNRITVFTIESSATLDSKQLDVIHAFLADSTHCTILSKAEVNKKLIAGLRLQSSTHLWEYSIRKQINILKKKAAVGGHCGN